METAANVGAHTKTSQQKSLRLGVDLLGKMYAYIPGQCNSPTWGRYAAVA